MKRAFPEPQEAVEMDREALAMCMLDRLICTPEHRLGELRYRDGFINHHVTHAFQERARELATGGVLVTHSVDARAALPEFADALLEAWVHLERNGYLIADERRRRVLISRDGQNGTPHTAPGTYLPPSNPHAQRTRMATTMRHRTRRRRSCSGHTRTPFGPALSETIGAMQY